MVLPPSVRVGLLGFGSAGSLQTCVVGASGEGSPCLLSFEGLRSVRASIFSYVWSHERSCSFVSHHAGLCTIRKCLFLLAVVFQVLCIRRYLVEMCEGRVPVRDEIQFQELNVVVLAGAFTSAAGGFPYVELDCSSSQFRKDSLEVFCEKSLSLFALFAGLDHPGLEVAKMVPSFLIDHCDLPLLKLDFLGCFSSAPSTAFLASPYFVSYYRDLEAEVCALKSDICFNPTRRGRGQRALSTSVDGDIEGFPESTGSRSTNLGEFGDVSQSDIDWLARILGDVLGEDTAVEVNLDVVQVLPPGVPDNGVPPDLVFVDAYECVEVPEGFDMASYLRGGVSSPGEDDLGAYASSPPLAEGPRSLALLDEGDGADAATCVVVEACNASSVGPLSAVHVDRGSPLGDVVPVGDDAPAPDEAVGSYASVHGCVETCTCFSFVPDFRHASGCWAEGSWAAEPLHGLLDAYLAGFSD